MKSVLSYLILVLCTLSIQAQTKIASLSPLLSDLAMQIGGDTVVVINLLANNSNPHTFSPTPKTLRKASGARLYLASGKGMEPYLPKLKATLGNSAEVLEVGHKIRSLHIKGGSSVYACCPNHSAGAVDPHWWHSIENWQKAAKILTSKLSEIDPANKSLYEARSKAYRSRLAILKSWAKRELSFIPKNQRQLATAHAAFGYFCKEFSFQSIPLRGLNSEQSVTTQYLQTAISIIKEKRVKAIFPDESSNPKALRTAADSAGVKLGNKIYADTYHSIEGMFRHNISTIAAAMR